MGWIIDGFKSFHNSVKEGEHLKEENLRTREELAEIQLRRGKLCFGSLAISAVIFIFFLGWSLEKLINNMVTVILMLAGVSGIGAGLYNKKIRLQ